MACCLHSEHIVASTVGGKRSEFCASFDPCEISAVSMSLVGVLCHQFPSLSATVVELTVILAGLVIKGCSVGGDSASAAGGPCPPTPAP